MARLVVLRHGFGAARSGGQPRCQAVARGRRFAPLGTVERRRSTDRGRIAPRPLPLRRAHLGFGRQRGIALQSRYARAVQREGGPGVPAHGSGRMASRPACAQPFGQPRGRAVRRQHRAPFLERLDSHAHQCLERGRPLVAGCEVGGPKEAVLRKRVCPVPRAQGSQRDASGEPGGHLYRQRSAAGRQVLDRTVAGPEHPEAATEHQGYSRRSFGPGAEGCDGCARLAHRRHVAGDDQSAMPAGPGRLRGDSRQGFCPAHGGAVLGNGRPAHGRSSAARSSKRPTPPPWKARRWTTILTRWFSRNSSAILD